MKNNWISSIQHLICLLLIALIAGCASPGARLNKAIRTNDYDAVVQQITEGVDINNPGELYSTPLITAIHHQYKNIARLLLDNGADPDKSDKEGLEPLKEAVKLQDYEMVRLLLNSGANPAQGECDALYVAIETIADHVMVNLLADNGGDLHKKHVYDVLTYKEALDSFVELPPSSKQPADLPHSVVMSGSALFVAISKGYNDIAKVLIEHGSDINELDTYGRTLLMIAVINNHKDTTKLLLDYKPDLSLKNQAENALQYASEHESDDIADILKKALESWRKKQHSQGTAG